MPVAELLARTGSRELTEWMAYSRIEPFGPLQQADEAGWIAATVWNSNLVKGKPRTPADYFPQLREAYKPTRKRQSPQQMFDGLVRAFLAIGAKRANGSDG